MIETFPPPFLSCRVSWSLFGFASRPRSYFSIVLHCLVRSFEHRLCIPAWCLPITNYPVLVLFCDAVELLSTLVFRLLRLLPASFQGSRGSLPILYSLQVFLQSLLAPQQLQHKPVASIFHRLQHSVAAVCTGLQ